MQLANKMKLLIWMSVLFFKYANASRAGVTQCVTSETYGSSLGSTGSSGSTTSDVHMMQDPAYQFQCCGVVKEINFRGTATGLNFYVWRQYNNDDKNQFDLISYQTYTASGTSCIIPENQRASFREGDLFGWNPVGGVINSAANSAINLNWLSDTSAVTMTVPGQSTSRYEWYNEDVEAGKEYLIEVVTTESTAPFFRNLPITLVKTVNELKFGGVTLMTLSYDDIDPDDASDGNLTVSMSPEWNDLFELESTGVLNSMYLKTRETLAAGSYSVDFRVEEYHCGLDRTATLTLDVTDETPKFTNLPALVWVHEDDEDETLLYTVSISDAADQGIWCEDTWDIGPASVSTKPFIVKMLSTEGGNSEAGIYLTQYPQLDFGIAETYDLTISCTDAGNIAISGIVKVNVIENQIPVFTNLGNMVQIDATSVFAGYTVFTVSTTDADLDQVGYTCSNCDGTTIPFAIFDSGEVQVTDLLLFKASTKYSLTINAFDHRGTTTDHTLVVYVLNTNSDPVFSIVDSSISVDENEELGKSIYQMPGTDNDTSDTLTYFMTVNPEDGYDLFELSSNGELTTHSEYTINYELLTATTTFTLTIYVNDGKTQVKDTIDVIVNDVNEAPYFLASEYIVTQNESDTTKSFDEDPGIGTAVDPDSDTLTFTMDCGAQDSYISMDPSSGTLSFPNGYNLDNSTLDLPTYFQCTVYVNDTSGLSDNATLHVNIEYSNEYPPVIDTVLTNGTPSVGYDAAVGDIVTQVYATDDDLGSDSKTLYSLTFPVPPPYYSNYFVIDADGAIRLSQRLDPTFQGQTITGITVIVTDEEGKNDQMPFYITVTDPSANLTTTTTTERSWEFVEDPRNTTWLTMTGITIATCLFIILCTVIGLCMKRTKPLININIRSLLPKKEPKRKIDKKGRPMPLFGKQAQPQYRHVHAKEVLRESPVSSPTPVEEYSLRPGSATSGRVTVTDVRVKDKEPSWMDGTSSPISGVAPVKSVTHARTDDWEYVNPNRRVDLLSPDQVYGNSKVSPSPSTALSKQRRSSSQRLTQAVHIPVSPSPVMMDNVDEDDDDFKSERLSIASPSSQVGNDGEPIY